MTESSAPTRDRRARPLSADSTERISAGCYGALVAASTLIGLNEAPLGSLVLLVVLTNLIYYATHVFAYTVGDRTEGTTSGWTTIKHHARISAPMVLVTFVPILVVVILELTGVARNESLLWGVVTAVLYLVGVATSGAYLRGLRPMAVAVVGIVTFILSLALVLAKLALH